MERKEGFAVVFTDITRKGAIPEEASIHTAEMTAINVALMELHKKKDKRWVLYIHTLRALCSPLNTIKKITQY